MICQALFFTSGLFMTRKNDDEVIKKIKIAMAEMGLNQSMLAKKLGVKPNTISQWLSGTNSPKIDTLKKIAKATGKPVNYFFAEVKGNNNAVGHGAQVGVPADVQKDIKLLSAQVELLTVKMQLMEKEIKALKKSQCIYPTGDEG